MSEKIVLLFVFLVISCSHLDKNADILSNGDFKNIIYLQNPDPKIFRATETVTVTNFGEKATIFNTLPDLYRNVLKKAKNASVSNDLEAKIYVSRLELEPSARSVPFYVPYQECKEKPIVKNVPRLNCLSIDNCRTTYETETVLEKICETKSREESRNVLNQTARATIFIKIKEANEKK